MPKKRYMLTGHHAKPCTHSGFRVLERPGNQPNGIEAVQVPFVPGKITSVETDIDMTVSVEAGFIVEIREVAPEAPDAPTGPEETEATKDAPDPPKEDDAPPADDQNSEPEGDDEPEEEEEEEEEEASYEELPDGRFQCLICKLNVEEKILKTEKGMIDHIQDKH